MLAFSYIRFSSPDQATKAGKYRHSLDRQLKRSQEYCDKHGLTLDSSTYQDLGLSAYKGANLEVGRLGQFIEAVESGRIPKGSILIVESLDRLSRQEVPTALELFLRILRLGIVIVTLTPEDRFEHGKISEIQLIIAIITLSRAYNESLTKSDRVGKAWAAKRNRIATEKLTARCPSWLKLIDGEFVEVPENVALVRRIFALAANGFGLTRIVKLLNSEGLKTFRGATWGMSSVMKILHNKAVIGEFQPRHGRGGTTLSKRPLAGDVVPDYYPAIITDAEFYAVQDAMRQRATQQGRQGERVTNLFSRLLVSVDGSPMTISRKDKTPNLVSRHAARGVSGKYVSFSYDAFEGAFLALVGGVSFDLLTVNEKQSAKAQELTSAQNELIVITGKLAELQAQIDADPDFAVLLPTVKNWSQKQQAAEKLVEKLKGEVSTEQTDSHQVAKHLIHKIAKTTGQDLIELRLQLRSKIASMVEKVEIEIVQGEGNYRELNATVHFTKGKSAQFTVWKTVTYSGGGSTNPKPKTEYAGQTIAIKPTECFRIRDGHVYVGIGSFRDKSTPVDFLVKGNVSLKKIL